MCTFQSSNFSCKLHLHTTILHKPYQTPQYPTNNDNHNSILTPITTLEIGLRHADNADIKVTRRWMNQLTRDVTYSLPVELPVTLLFLFFFYRPQRLIFFFFFIVDEWFFFFIFLMGINIEIIFDCAFYLRYTYQ